MGDRAMVLAQLVAPGGLPHMGGVALLAEDGGQRLDRVGVRRLRAQLAVAGLDLAVAALPHPHDGRGSSGLDEGAERLEGEGVVVLEEGRAAAVGEDVLLRRAAPAAAPAHGPLPLDDPTADLENAQVAADGGGGDPEALGQLGGRRRPVGEELLQHMVTGGLLARSGLPARPRHRFHEPIVS